MSSERIEGLPIGVRIARVLTRRLSGPEEVIAMLEPANDYGVLDLSTVPISEGYEHDGNSPEEWFRSPRNKERYVHPCGTVAKNDYDLDLPPRIIVRPVKKTKRVLVVEHILGNMNVETVGFCTGASDLIHPVKFRIEERDE